MAPVKISQMDTIPKNRKIPIQTVLYSPDGSMIYLGHWSGVVSSSINCVASCDIACIE